MPSCGGDYIDRSAEYRKWEKHYRNKGCSEMKILKLVHKKMRRG